MIRIFLKLTFFLLAFLTMSVASFMGVVYASEQAKALSEKLQAKYDQLQDLEGVFLQETTQASSVKPRISKGKMYFKRPNLMRWDYETPEPQSIIVTKDTVFVYEKEMNQVMLMPREDYVPPDVSSAFFLEKGRLTALFEVDMAGKTFAEPDWTLKLTPKPAQDKKNDDTHAQGLSTLKNLWIQVDPTTTLIKQLWFEDATGTKQHFVFENVKTNQKLENGLFSFEIPQGVEVYRAGSK